MRESLTPRENGKSLADDVLDLSPCPPMGNDRRNTANNIHSFLNTNAVIIFDKVRRQHEFVVYFGFELTETP
jgi:hypothetical protein